MRSTSFSGNHSETCISFKENTSNRFTVFFSLNFEGCSCFALEKLINLNYPTAFESSTDPGDQTS